VNRTPSTISPRNTSPRAGAVPLGSTKFFGGTNLHSPTASGSSSAAGSTTSLSSLFQSSAGNNEPQPRLPAELTGQVKMQGWVTREEAGREGSIYKPWVKQYLVLTMDPTSNAFVLKYAATPAVVEFPSQLKGTLRLSRDMKVVCNNNSAIANTENANNPNSQSDQKNFMVQVLDGRGMYRISFLVDSQADQVQWYEQLCCAVLESQQ
jgi:hypothetical protein